MLHCPSGNPRKSRLQTNQDRQNYSTLKSYHPWTALWYRACSYQPDILWRLSVPVVQPYPLHRCVRKRHLLPHLNIGEQGHSMGVLPAIDR